MFRAKSIMNLEKTVILDNTVLIGGIHRGAQVQVLVQLNTLFLKNTERQLQCHLNTLEDIFYRTKTTVNY